MDEPDLSDAEFDALPDRVKRLVHALETRADPARDLRRRFVAEQTAGGLLARNEDLRQAIATGMQNMDIDASEQVGSLEDVRRRVQEFEMRVQAGQQEHNSLSRDRAFLMGGIDRLVQAAGKATR